MTLNAPPGPEGVPARELRFGARKLLIWTMLGSTLLLPLLALVLYAAGKGISDRFLVACAIFEPFMVLCAVFSALSKLVISPDGIRLCFFFRRRQLRWDQVVSFGITDEDVVLLRTAVGAPLKFGLKAFEHSDRIRAELVRRLGEPAHEDTSEVGIYRGPEEPRRELPDDVQELRPRRMKASLLLAMAAIPALANVLIELMIRDKPPSTVASIGAAIGGAITGLVLALVQEIMRRKYRLYLADEGFLVGARRTKQMVLWRDVRSVAFDKKTKLLVIHAGEAQRPVRIMLGMFANWKQVMAAIELHLPDGVCPVEITGTANAPAAVAIAVGGLLVLVFVPVAIVFGLFRHVTPCASGLVAGVLVSLAVAQRTLSPLPGRPWRCLAISGILVVASIALAVVWGAIAHTERAIAMAFALCFTIGLLVTQAVVLVRHGYVRAVMPVAEGAAIKDV